MGFTNLDIFYAMIALFFLSFMIFIMAIETKATITKGLAVVIMVCSVIMGGIAGANHLDAKDEARAKERAVRVCTEVPKSFLTITYEGDIVYLENSGGEMLVCGLPEPD